MASICLLAAGQGAGDLIEALFQHREHGQHLFLGLPDAGLVIAQEGAHAQVFVHRETAENASTFGNLHNALGDHVVRRHVVDVLVAEGDGALRRGQDAGDGVEGGGLARPIGADQGDDLVLVHVQGDALQRVDLAVEDVEIVDFEKCHGLLPSYFNAAMPSAPR